MRVHYDTEFHERGVEYPVELISIGLIADDGRELYLVNGELHLEALLKHEFLMREVVPNLPLLLYRDSEDNPSFLDWDYGNEVFESHVFDRATIRSQLTEFFDNTPSPELWGYCSGYDHVVLAQCFGTMVDMHPRLRFYTNDIAQLALPYKISTDSFPRHTGVAHNALADARWTKEAHEWLDETIAEGYRQTRLMFGG